MNHDDLKKDIDKDVFLKMALTLFAYALVWFLLTVGFGVVYVLLPKGN